MTKFCVDCGHSNDEVNRVCVQCGNTFSVSSLDKKPNVVTQKASSVSGKKMSLKRKVLSILTIFLIVGVMGVSFWGTKTASAESTVAKFLEALQTEDAKILSKLVILSSGQQLSENEAKAFIKLYQDITPNELENILSIEKSGKVMGLFNAHKIVVTPQDLSYYFPYDGLTIKIGEKTYSGKANDREEYIFSNIPPGIHKAEFIYKGDFTTFNHPFELTVYQKKDKELTQIQEVMPLDTVTFELQNYVEAKHNQSAILINGQEYLVDQNGYSPEIGPLLLDGSQNAQAKQQFPWGVQLSELTPIIENHMSFSITKLEAEQESAIIEQLLLYGEETTEATGTRNSKVYTTLTDEMLSAREDEIESMIYWDRFYKGALSEINLDEESIEISEDGYSVRLNAEIVTHGDEYYNSETLEMADVKEEVIVYFVFDANQNKWLVYGYSAPWNSSNISYSKKIEGSNKVYQTTRVTDEKEEQSTSRDEDENAENITDDIQLFFYQYNSMSVAAINQGDFSLVSNLITVDGPRRSEQAQFITNLYDKGITEEHLDTVVEEVKKMSDSQWKVTTKEEFIIHGVERSSEKSYRTVTIIKKVNGNWLVHELISTTEL
ncbi:hypothetical protein [Paenisporosarcina sp. TG20]|uniref:TcaA NTF2-like domain-containing protein n=1 Tax=Paenisporosarcina sp. TG20 TaxID=1211706 RepID=UPI0002E76E08|nr:hypothetical protein [Paenisporosarcina sp. TG20]